MKKFMAFILAVLMLSAMAPSAFAANVDDKSPPVAPSVSVTYEDKSPPVAPSVSVTYEDKSPPVAPSALAANVDDKAPSGDTSDKVLGWKAYNEDTVGWLYIPDTKINNVIVQSKDDNNYYLRRNAKREMAFDGCYFADYRGDFSDGGLPANTVIYGHSFDGNPKGKKFSQLLKYLDDDFAAEHPYIYFSDGERTYIFRVFAVFTTDVNLPYNNPNMDSETREKVLETAKSLSVREYKSQPSPVSRLLTLSTNAYTDGNGERVAFEGYPNNYRFVVMAKLVKASDSK